MREADGYRRVPVVVDVVRDGGDGSSPRLLPPSEGLSSVAAELLLGADGPHSLSLVAVSAWRLFLQCCLGGPTQLVAWVLVAACAAVTGRWVSCLILSAALLLAAVVPFLLLRRVRAAAVDAVASGHEPPAAVVLRDGRWQNLPPSVLVPGDLVRLRAGAVAPADCTVDAAVELNEGGLTGESLPVAVGPGAFVRMGTVVLQGEAGGTVQATGARAHAGRTLAPLLAAPQPYARGRSKCAGLHSAVARTLFGCAAVVAAVAMVDAGLSLGARQLPLAVVAGGMVLLVLRSLPLGLESAAAAVVARAAWTVAEQTAVLFVRPSAVASLSAVDVLFVDKTGTLTTNGLALQEECHTFRSGYAREEVIQFAALALRWREPAVDPLDVMILGATDLDACDGYTQLAFHPFSHETGRTEATVRAPDGAVFAVTKGIIGAVLQLVQGRDELRRDVEQVVGDLGRRGMRCLMVARTAAASPPGDDDTGGDAVWHVAGLLAFLDPLRSDAADALQRLEAHGVAVKVITGDHPLVTKEIGRRLGLGNTAVATATAVFARYDGDDDDGSMDAGATGVGPLYDAALGENYGGVLQGFSIFADASPQHKRLAVETERQCGHTVGFVGDGVNDVLAMHHADVSVALAAPPSWAHAAADAVTVVPSLSAVVDALIIARGAMRAAEAVVCYRICSVVHTAMFCCLSPFVTIRGATGDTALRLPPLVAAIHTSGLLLLTVALAADRPPPPERLTRPHAWNITAVAVVMTPVVAVGLASSLLLQWLLAGVVETAEDGGVVDLPLLASSVPRPFAAAALYLQLALSTTLPVLSCRVRADEFVWTRAPSVVVAAALVASLAAATAAAAFMPDAAGWLGPVSAPFAGLWYSGDGAVRLLLAWVWVWCLGWWVVQEGVRVGVSAVVLRLKILHLKETLGGCRPPRPIDRDGPALDTTGRAPHGVSLGALGAAEHRLVG